MLFNPLDTECNGIYVGQSNKPFEHPQAHWRDYIRGYDIFYKTLINSKVL